MKCSNEELIAFQELLMETFYNCNDAELVQVQLNSSIQNPVLLNWSSNLNLDMLEVAARMVQHWGIKS
ncbi:hypothetical protein Lsan_1811 [Legionella santicrucis]|uniref:Uncharacterized protein n=1 Tax=Legionella santicrucis TaxID=45074 RepID=A0A0W0Z0K1_9GAMM|nr:hypothetical protein [Legionella santicrucis]KTD62278.1 hypothetical protein Lsan_1811 [Legionella santicrucis]